MIPPITERPKDDDGRDCGRAEADRRPVAPLRWFVAGFLLVFAGMLVGTRVFSMLPSGEGVVALPLWQYYVVEVHRAIFGPRGLGPAFGSTRGMIQAVAEHLLCSAAGGAVMAGIDRAIGKARGHRQGAR
jgi:hypothetical protein